MQFEVVYDDALRCVVISTKGKLDMSAVANLAESVHPVLEEKGWTRVLHDLRRATVNLSTPNIYDLPRFVSLASPSVATARRALVVREDAEADDYQFFETVSRNQGQNTQFFTDMEEAKRWLQGGDRPPPPETPPGDPKATA